MKKGGTFVTVILCISDSGGMMFNKRRQSRDVKVVEDILDISADKVLFISEYSAPLFAGSRARVVSEPLESAGAGDIVFIEDRHIMPYIDDIDGLVIYKWNRNYPADLSLDIDPERVGFVLDSSTDFAGNSHEKVTRLIWKRR